MGEPLSFVIYQYYILILNNIYALLQYAVYDLCISICTMFYAICSFACIWRQGQTMQWASFRYMLFCSMLYMICISLCTCIMHSFIQSRRVLNLTLQHNAIYNELSVQYAKCTFLFTNKCNLTCNGSKIKQQTKCLCKMSNQRIKISQTLVLSWLTFPHKYLHFRIRCSIHSSAAGVDDIPKGECLGHNSNNLKI